MNFALIGLFAVLMGGAAVLIRLISKEDREAQEEYRAGRYSLDALCRRVPEAINAVINTDLETLNLSTADREKRARAKYHLMRCTRDACLGDPGDREFVKDYIKDILQEEGIDSQTICRAVPFALSEKMSARDKFEYMYAMYQRVYPSRAFSYMVRDFKLDAPKTDGLGMKYYAVTDDDIEAAYAACPFTPTFSDRLEMLAQRIYSRLYGNDVADIFISDDSVSDVEAGTGGKTRQDYNFREGLDEGDGEGQEEPEGPADPFYWDTLFIRYAGKLIRMSFLSFGGDRNLKRVVENIYRYKARVQHSQKDPVLQSKLKNDSRVMVLGDTVSVPSAYVRMFRSATPKKIESLFTQPGSDRLIAVLIGLIRGGFKMLITGVTGSGKTTTLKALIRYVDPQQEIRTVESEFELYLSNLYPYKNIHALQESATVTMYDLLKHLRKMNTTMLIVGEINEPKLAGAFIQASQTSDTTISTLHPTNLESLVDYMRNAYIAEEGMTDAGIAEEQVIKCLNFNIHQERDGEGNYYIARITEVEPAKYAPYPEDDPAGAARQYYERRTDARRYAYHNVVEFDRKDGRYYVTGDLSQASKAKLRVALGDEAAERLFDIIRDGLDEYGDVLKARSRKEEGTA